MAKSIPFSMAADIFFDLGAPAAQRGAMPGIHTAGGGWWWRATTGLKGHWEWRET